jgi:hypothetical protein
MNIEDRIYQPIFSFIGDFPNLINARTSFLELRDPTGYRWAMKYLGSYEHFENLRESPWFESEYQAWLREYKIMIKSEAVQKIIEIASEDSPQAFQASKYLASADWEKAAYGRGRPSQAELKGELKKAVTLLQAEDEDAQRMGLKVIPGGKK